jgi:hypothetical protein
MVIFAVGVVVVAWLLAAGLIFTKDALKQLAGLWLVPLMIVPLVLAYVGHRASGATGNPFKGLVWGNTSWYFLTWIGGLLVSAIAIAAGIGLGFNRLDPGMASYVDMMASQAAQNSGGASEAELATGMRLMGYITAFSAPTILPWIGAAIGSIGTFPWYGWFFRRAQVGGRANAVMIVMALSLVTAVVGGFADNPMMADSPLWVQLTVNAFAGMALVPAVAWVFLRTRSAVIPALAIASYQNGLAAATPFLSIEQPLFASPGGLVVSAVALAAGIGLWVWKDPGGEDLAVAAVAHDGTPLTPEQAMRLDEGDLATPPAPEVREGLSPPPPTPGEIQGLPPDSETPEHGTDDQGGAGGQ